MARPRKQKAKWWRPKEDYDYEESWEEWRDEDYQRW